MTAAFAVAAAVAVLAIVWAVVTARKSAAQLATERSHADQLEGELRTARQAGVEAESRLNRAEEARVAAEQRRDVPERSAPEVAGRLAAADTLWDLERVRLEREWREVTGIPTPLPEPWDGSLRAAVAVELELIREVIGIPTRLEPGGGSPEGQGGGGSPTGGSPIAASPTAGSPTTGSPTTGSPTTGSPTTGSPPGGAPTAGAPTAGGLPAGASSAVGPADRYDPSAPRDRDSLVNLGSARLTAEILRALARVGEEMTVSVEHGGSVSMNVATEGPTPEPDLRHLAGNATALGGDLVVRAVPGGIEARLRLPGPAA